jgi:hypothetical protein
MGPLVIVMSHISFVKSLLRTLFRTLGTRWKRSSERRPCLTTRPQPRSSITCCATWLQLPAGTRPCLQVASVSRPVGRFIAFVCVLVGGIGGDEEICKYGIREVNNNSCRINTVHSMAQVGISYESCS